MFNTSRERHHEPEQRQHHDEGQHFGPRLGLHAAIVASTSSAVAVVMAV
jgi:hypothetical protein